MTNLETRNDENVARLAAARRLHDDVEQKVSGSFPQMVSLAEEIKRDHPELADRIDRVIGNSMLRTALMPQMLTSLFLAQTEDPPEVIEGEIVEEDPSLEDEAVETEVQDE